MAGGELAKVAIRGGQTEDATKEKARRRQVHQRRSRWRWWMHQVQRRLTHSQRPRRQESIRQAEAALSPAPDSKGLAPPDGYDRGLCAFFPDPACRIFGPVRLCAR